MSFDFLWFIWKNIMNYSCNSERLTKISTENFPSPNFTLQSPWLNNGEWKLKMNYKNSKEWTAMVTALFYLMNFVNGLSHFLSNSTVKKRAIPTRKKAWTIPSANHAKKKWRLFSQPTQKRKENCEGHLNMMGTVPRLCCRLIGSNFVIIME